jgi:hypothetical protein
MKSVFVITMWSGGRPARKWQSEEEPEVLPNGMGVEFVSRDTKLHVRLIGSISVEEYESGKEEIEMGGYYHRSESDPEPLRGSAPVEDPNIRRLF